MKVKYNNACGHEVKLKDNNISNELMERKVSECMTSNFKEFTSVTIIRDKQDTNWIEVYVTFDIEEVEDTEDRPCCNWITDYDVERQQEENVILNCMEEAIKDYIEV